MALAGRGRSGGRAASVERARLLRRLPASAVCC